MAWNPSPMVAVARDFGKQFDSKQVVILFIKNDNRIGYASWGKTRNLCAEAQQFADALYEKLGDEVLNANTVDEIL